jgi:hypothetical protein
MQLIDDTQPVRVIALPEGTNQIDEAEDYTPRAGVNWLKWSLGCLGVTMFLVSGAIMAGLILMPVVFRSLDPELRYRLVKNVPVLGTLEPTRVYRATTLPTVEAADPVAIAALLSTETATPLPTSIPTIAPTSLLATITPTPLLGQPVAMDATSTRQPTPTTLPTQFPTIPPTPTEKPTPLVWHLNGIKRVFQKWNDCGPANLTQALGYYGWSGTENDARAAIKPTNDDRNVSPWELTNFVNKRTGVKALSRVAGNLKLIKQLISSNFPVIIETGYDLPDGWAGHYLTILGYDDNQGVLFGGDTNLGFGADGLGIPERYDDIDKRWQAFNRLYIVVYPREREQELAGILGRDADPTENLRHAQEVAQAEANKNKDNPFAWFNLGSVWTQMGDYKRAVVAFGQSRNTGTQLPWRFLWYQFTPFEAYYKSGDFNEVKILADITLANAPIEEARYWRGMAAAATGDRTAAMEDFKWVLRFNPNYSAAADALAKVQNGTFQPPETARIVNP